MLGGYTHQIDAEGLKDFFSYVKSYSSLSNLKKIIKDHQNKEKLIDRSNIKKIATMMLKKPELRGVFKSYCSKYTGEDMEEVMTFEEWSAFLQSVQGDKMDKRYFMEMIGQLKNPQLILGCKRTVSTQRLSFLDFSNVIFSDYNLAMNPSKDQVFMEMDRPLCNYFINTLHNTYLDPIQNTNLESCKSFYDAIKAGARCIEIDTWDGAKHEPIVASPKNLANMIPFEEVIKCLAKWVFKFSDYPFILCIENHCGLDQMIKMKNILNKYFADSIFRTTEKQFLSESFPSPEKLKRKVKIGLTSDYLKS